MSRESNTISLRKAFERPFKEPRLIGVAFAEIGVLLLAALLFYAISLRVLMTQYNIPTETLMTFFANGALPPEAATLVAILVTVFSVLISIIAVYFEAGLFGIIATTKTFFEAAKNTFLIFLVIVIVFEILDFFSLIFSAPTLLFLWWELVGLVLVFLAQLFFVVWKMIAQFSAVKKGPIKSLKESWWMLVKNLGHWGFATLTVLIAAAILLLVAFAVLIPAALNIYVLVAVLFVLGVISIYFGLVVRIFFFNRIHAMKK